jgi:hypothetical protein
VLTAREAANRPAGEVFRDLRSGAESGWDFSSRWMADGKSLKTIQTTAILPVDLNALMYGLETAIAQGCAELVDAPCVAEFSGRAKARRTAMDAYLWDAPRGLYLDYQWRERTRLDHPSAATLYPLFVGAASPDQAKAVAATTRALLLAPGGLRTTTVSTGQQWDTPNGWARCSGWPSRACAATARRPGQGHRPALAGHRRARVQGQRQDAGEVRRRGGQGRRRRRIPAAGRLRLDQRRDPRAARPLSGAALKPYASDSPGLRRSTANLATVESWPPGAVTLSTTLTSVRHRSRPMSKTW